jgi:hypothetical protein
MVEPLRHRQTKEAATDMFYLKPPRHISTLPFPSVGRCLCDFRLSPDSGGIADIAALRIRANCYRSKRAFPQGSSHLGEPPSLALSRTGTLPPFNFVNA